MKNKQVFEKPFIGTTVYDGVTLLYNRDGNYSAILKFENPAKHLGADPSKYIDQHDLLGEIVKKTGPGHNLQKTDIISKQKFDRQNTNGEYYRKNILPILKTGFTTRSRLLSPSQKKQPKKDCSVFRNRR